LFPCHFTKQACFTQVDSVCSPNILSQKEEPESFQLQHEEVPVSPKSISPQCVAQGFELASSSWSLESNFHFDREITKEISFGTKSPSPSNLLRLEAAEPVSLFGFKPKPGGGIDLTQQKSLQTPACTKPAVCVNIPEPAPPALPRISFQAAVGGVKPVYSSCGAPMQGVGLFGSAIPLCASSGKTDVEKQVIPKFRLFQANGKEALSESKCKKKAKKAVFKCDVTAPEEGFAEKFEVVVSLPSVVFYI